MVDKIKIDKQKKDKIQEIAFKFYPRLINDEYNPMEDDNENYRNIWIHGAEWQKEYISNSIEQVINDICKDNTHLIDTPEIQEIIKYFKK